ncbi:uncharacterized protein K460DRAFT_92787 [Cucurbitaria berberidis CBS 394.84]|uniref:Uncharacterized protein n=1 Tax=Cucurbitaria berberidis CBS 394.84 TaxID=1168544 RepID=A0A9P4L6Z3_9PLEO|nr:uncharacterized protein K460DRAFT_92787 [Cucurbitaria berberidis CBS 394.84]KAF1844491.1 hypothetical protein K460DRAFT_92787 [Cucurbitaria berberidis CBS 394.84]
MLTNVYTTYLSFEGVEKILASRKERLKFLDANKLYAYAAGNWGNHARIASSGYTQVNPQVMDFLERPFKVEASTVALWQSSAERYTGGVPDSLLYLPNE